MTRVSIFAFAALFAACAHNNDLSSQQVEPTIAEALASQAGEKAAGASSEGTVLSNEGQVTVAGIPPSRVLGAIDTKAVKDMPTIANGGDAPTSDKPTSNATPGIAVEGAQPSAVLAAIDPTKLVGDQPPQGSAAGAMASDGYIAPTVQAVVDKKKTYTTRDLAMAQLEAVKGDGG